MQTHSDSDFPPSFINRLRERAAESEARGDGRITAGTADEQPLAEWTYKNVHCVHRPNDEQGILRVSVGGMVSTQPRFVYCVFRGPRGQCIAALEQALEALRRGDPA